MNEKRDAHTNPALLQKLLLNLSNPSEPVSFFNWEHIFTRALITLQMNHKGGEEVIT